MDAATFHHNSAGRCGGALAFDDLVAGHKAALTDASFSHNRASVAGGALYWKNGSSALQEQWLRQYVSFSDNAAAVGDDFSSGAPRLARPTHRTSYPCAR